MIGNFSVSSGASATECKTDAPRVCQSLDSATDLVVFGNAAQWYLACKESSHNLGCTKTTKFMDVGSGVVVQTETQQCNADGSCGISQSTVFVASAKAVKNASGEGFYLDLR